MLSSLLPLFILSWLVPLILAQNQEPIYVPFEWSKVPASASLIASSAGTTTYALIDTGGSPLRATPGPGTLIQSSSGASMIYVNPAGAGGAAATPTLSGVCNLFTPVAVCTLNVYETGAAIPVEDGFAATTATGTSGHGTSTSTSTGVGGGGGGAGLRGGAVGSKGGMVFAMGTLAFGFCIGLAFVR